MAYVAVGTVTDKQTHRQTDKLSTVTPAAHARRGLIIHTCIPVYVIHVHACV